MISYNICYHVNIKAVMECRNLKLLCIHCLHESCKNFKGIMICDREDCYDKIEYFDKFDIDLSECNCQSTEKCTESTFSNIFYVNYHDSDGLYVECFFDFSYAAFCRTNKRYLVDLLEACDYKNIKPLSEYEKYDIHILKNDVNEMKAEIKEVKGLIRDLMDILMVQNQVKIFIYKYLINVLKVEVML